MNIPRQASDRSISAFAVYAIANLLAVTGCIDTDGSASDVRVEEVAESLTACVNLPVADDATLSFAEMQKSFGAQKMLRVDALHESLIRFELASVPAGASVDSATLQVYLSDTSHNRPIDLHRVARSWSERNVTFASFAQRFEPRVLGSIIAKQDGVQKTVDLTQLTRAWVGGAQPNFGVLLESPVQGEATLVSSEGGTDGQKPSLRVCYTVPDDHCASHPCLNRGSCENRSAGYACECAAGFDGANCELNIDDCASMPCQNGGTCADSANAYSCSCAPGFAGASCEIDVDECSPSPCRNGGVCTDQIAGFSCACPPGYAGALCETLMDNCAAAPCQNAGTCSNRVNGYACSCAVGFAGTNCEVNVDDCATQTCRNGGTCIDGVNAASCACPPDWGGATCEINLNSCGQSPCLNGAACLNSGGGYACACAPGFAGTNCENDVDDCAASPCQHGGICIDGVNSYTCTCVNGFMGASCQIVPTAELLPAICDCDQLEFNANQSISLDASCSSNSAATQATTRYEWDLDYQGSPASFTPEASGAQVTLQIGFATYGTYPVALRMIDQNAQVVSDRVAVCNITISPPPHCPRANAGGDSRHTYYVDVQQVLQLDARGSFDADGDPMTYHWDFHGGSQFMDATGPTPTFMYNVPGTYVAAVRVTDHPELNAAPYTAADCNQDAYATVIVGPHPGQ